MKTKMKIKFIQNKKADVPVMILVLGVIAICALAIGSFIVAELKGTKGDLLGIELIEGIHSDIDKFYFYKDLGFANQEAVDMVNQYIMLTKVLDEDKLILNGSKLVINRDRNSISIKYIKSLSQYRLESFINKIILN